VPLLVEKEIFDSRHSLGRVQTANGRDGMACGLSSAQTERHLVVLGAGSKGLVAGNGTCMRRGGANTAEHTLCRVFQRQ